MVAVLWGATAAASAQVRLHGQVDAFYERVGTGGGNTLERVSSGGPAVSRWGLRGTEDLGGGMKANDRLETGFNADDGSVQTAGSAFSRWAHVGLSGPWGAIDAGRMWSPSFIIGLKADVLARNRTSLVTNLFRGSGTAATTGAALPGLLGNSLRYTTPEMQGFTGEQPQHVGSCRAPQQPQYAGLLGLEAGRPPHRSGAGGRRPCGWRSGTCAWLAGRL